MRREEGRMEVRGGHSRPGQAHPQHGLSAITPSARGWESGAKLWAPCLLHEGRLEPNLPTRLCQVELPSCFLAQLWTAPPKEPAEPPPQLAEPGPRGAESHAQGYGVAMVICEAALSPGVSGWQGCCCAQER